MPIMFYLPFIIATGMLSIAADAMTVQSKQKPKSPKDDDEGAESLFALRPSSPKYLENCHPL